MKLSDAAAELLRDDVEAAPSQDEAAGVEGVLCRSNFHPYKTLAAHVDIAGMAIWNGVKSEKKSKCGCLKLNCGHAHDENARPLNGWQQITTLRLYQPPTGRIEGEVPPVFDEAGAIVELLADRVDELIERLLPTAPRRVDGDVLGDAFVRMYRWKRFLPGWCTYDEPVAAALQAAFWIRRCNDLRFSHWDGWDLRDVLAARHPDRQVPQRKKMPIYRVTDDDIAATYLVIQHATMTSLRAVVNKERWKDSVFIVDRTILGLMLGEGRSASDIADEVGMSASMVARRFNAAIDAIAESLGRVAWPGLSSRNAKFVPRVETRWPEKRTDSPQLWTGPPRPRRETGYKFRDVSMPMVFEKLPFEKPAITDPGRPKQWGGGALSRRIKLTPTDTQRAIADYLAKSNIKRLPSGCAKDYPPETPRRFDRIIRASVDVNDDIVDGDVATSNSAGLFVPSWHNLRPRAADWRKIAHKLPAELKGPALEQESFIARVLADGIPSPHAPTAPVERRFATPYLNRLQDFWPREAKDGSTTYGEVTVWSDGKTEPASEKRRRLAKKRPEPRPRDAVDRINDLYVSE